MKLLINKALKLLGYQISKLPKEEKNLEEVGKEIHFPIDFGNEYQSIILKAKPFTMTSIERMYSLISSVEYIIRNQIPGDFVECGVWRGGSALVIILTLQRLGVSDRKVHLFDTFDGMSSPTKDDVSIYGESADKELQIRTKDENDPLWAYSPIEKVKDLLYGTGYPKEQLFFYKGKVEETIPTPNIEKISILRLDTDWYESTLHELQHLYPLLVSTGVIIIDDYGHWQGARKAVDEYFSDKKILLNRIDYTGRIAQKI